MEERIVEQMSFKPGVKDWGSDRWRAVREQLWRGEPIFFSFVNRFSD